MEMKYLSKNDYKVSEWSGGTTEQLCIYPEDATLQNKDFLFRISSASVNIPESDFSDFRGLIE